MHINLSANNGRCAKQHNESCCCDGDEDADGVSGEGGGGGDDDDEVAAAGTSPLTVLCVQCVRRHNLQANGSGGDGKDAPLAALMRRSRSAHTSRQWRSSRRHCLRALLPQGLDFRAKALKYLPGSKQSASVSRFVWGNHCFASNLGYFSAQTALRLSTALQYDPPLLPAPSA